MRVEEVNESEPTDDASKIQDAVGTVGWSATSISCHFGCAKDAIASLVVLMGMTAVSSVMSFDPRWGIHPPVWQPVMGL